MSRLTVKGGTRLTLIQSGVPDDQVEPIKEGWKEHNSARTRSRPFRSGRC